MQIATLFYFRFDRNKNIKLFYYLRGILRVLTPKRLCQSRLERTLATLDSRPDRDQILRRVDYCNKLATPVTLSPDSPHLSENTYGNRKAASVYFFDSYEFTRWFPQHLRWRLKGGDVTSLFDQPTIVKSRPVGDGNHNSVMLNMDKVRHFRFVRDRLALEDKLPVAQFAGWIGNWKRETLFDKYYGHPMVVLRNTGSGYPQWAAKKVTIAQQMRYRYILAIEGNDVATCLKWVMSSNSIAVMPRPQYETWFMEGSLVPGYHYIEVKPDYSDLIDKLEYYNAHLDEAQQILDHAHAYVDQFRDPEREQLISLLVLDKYFRMTSQKP